MGGAGSSRTAVRRSAAGAGRNGQKASVGPNGALGSGGVHKRGASGAGSSGGGVRVPTPSGGEVLLTRRHFLFGAAGVAALAAAGGAATVVIKQREEAANDVTVLEVPASSVTTLNTADTESSFTLIEDTASRMNLAARFELPYGSLVWASGDDVAACLVPTDQGSPLAQVALLLLGSGNQATVLEQAVGQDEGFDIYDVRATETGMVWTEADILDGIWRVYTARLDGATLGEPHLVDEGDNQWETPTIAAAGSHAFWQVMPRLDGDSSAEDSLVKRATMASGATETVYTSHGRLCTPPYALDDSVVITPRAETSGTYYQLTHLDAASGNVLDTMVLPRSMRPLEAGYGDNGFSFSFDAWYTYGDGIANIGTYTPASRVTDGNYSGAPWFSFGLAPTAPPAWCGGYFIVKSKRTVCGIDLDTSEYFALQPENGSDDYGEYLASTGSNNLVVTYANIDDKPIDGEPKKYCLVRAWSPVS
nr:Tat pathway signal protein [Gordonibacter massiliensis (ex Traore et al. 2017)]